MAYTLTSTTSSTSANGFGYSTATAEKAAQPFTTVGAGTMDQVTFSMQTVGTPTDSFIIEVQSDSAGSPSGTVLASYTGLASSITGTPTDYTYSFGVISLSASTKYWFVFRRSGALSAVNYYSSPGLTTGTEYRWLNSSVWTSNAGTQRYSFTITEVTNNGAGFFMMMR